MTAAAEAVAAAAAAAAAAQYEFYYCNYCYYCCVMLPVLFYVSATSTVFSATIRCYYHRPYYSCCFH